MKARRYEVTLTGETPLLMHNDNLAWSEVMDKWRKDPANKKNSVAGDDRSPAFRWIGSLYAENHQVVIPSDNIMTVLREGGKLCPTGKGQKTFKAQTQSGIVVDQSSWPLEINGNGPIDYDEIKQLKNEPDFSKHAGKAAEMGFELFCKRAKIGQARHIRVRPRFDNWKCSGTLTVFDEMITNDVLANILTFAGTYCGLCDWRPSSPRSPGPFGKFVYSVNEV